MNHPGDRRRPEDHLLPDGARTGAATCRASWATWPIPAPRPASRRRSDHLARMVDRRRKSSPAICIRLRDDPLGPPPAAGRSWSRCSTITPRRRLLAGTGGSAPRWCGRLRRHRLRRTAPSGAASCSPSPARSLHPGRAPRRSRCRAAGQMRHQPAASPWTCCPGPASTWGADLPPVAAVGPDGLHPGSAGPARPRVRDHQQHGPPVRRRVASLLGVCQDITYGEGQAAVELEHLARTGWPRHAGLSPSPGRAGPAPVIAGLVEGTARRCRCRRTWRGLPRRGDPRDRRQRPPTRPRRRYLRDQADDRRGVHQPPSAGRIVAGSAKAASGFSLHGAHRAATARPRPGHHRRRSLRNFSGRCGRAGHVPGHPRQRVVEIWEEARPDGDRPASGGTRKSVCLAATCRTWIGRYTIVRGFRDHPDSGVGQLNAEDVRRTRHPRTTNGRRMEIPASTSTDSGIRCRGQDPWKAIRRSTTRPWTIMEVSVADRPIDHPEPARPVARRRSRPSTDRAARCVTPLEDDRPGPGDRRPRRHLRLVQATCIVPGGHQTCSVYGRAAARQSSRARRWRLNSTSPPTTRTSEVVLASASVSRPRRQRAMSVLHAPSAARGLRNFSHAGGVDPLLVPPHDDRHPELADEPDFGVPGRRARMHGGWHLGYGPLVDRFRVPIVVTGFGAAGPAWRGCGRWSSCSRTARPSCAITLYPRAVAEAATPSAAGAGRRSP